MLFSFDWNIKNRLEIIFIIFIKSGIASALGEKVNVDESKLRTCRKQIDYSNF